MEIELTQRTSKRVYRLSWGQHELDVRPYPYNRTGRQYQPTRACIVVTRSFDEPWGVYSVVLGGRALKKDGTMGQQAVKEEFSSWRWERDDAPEELRTAVAKILAFLNDPAVSA